MRWKLPSNRSSLAPVKEKIRETIKTDCFATFFEEHKAETNLIHYSFINLILAIFHFVSYVLAMIHKADVAHKLFLPSIIGRGGEGKSRKLI